MATLYRKPASDEASAIQVSIAAGLSSLCRVFNQRVGGLSRLVFDHEVGFVAQYVARLIKRGSCTTIRRRFNAIDCLLRWFGTGRSLQPVETRRRAGSPTHVSSPALPFTLKAGFGGVWAKSTALENKLSAKARSVLCTAATYSRSAILLYHIAVFPKCLPFFRYGSLTQMGCGERRELDSSSGARMTEGMENVRAWKRWDA